MRWTTALTPEHPLCRLVPMLGQRGEEEICTLQGQRRSDRSNRWTATTAATAMNPHVPLQQLHGSSHFPLTWENCMGRYEAWIQYKLENFQWHEFKWTPDSRSLEKFFLVWCSTFQHFGFTSQGSKSLSARKHVWGESRFLNQGRLSSHLKSKPFIFKKHRNPIFAAKKSIFNRHSDFICSKKHQGFPPLVIPNISWARRFWGMMLDCNSSSPIISLMIPPFLLVNA